jgi:phosphate transport system substrate-binding protein
LASAALTAVLAAALAACGGAETGAENRSPQDEGAAEGGEHGSDAGASELAGTITIDGSSTVYPISQAVAEEFMKRYPGVHVTVSASGTGGGFAKFAAGELDIAGASRPQKQSEKEAAAANGIEGLELQIAYDGITVVINRENDWAETMTVEELKKLWEPEAEGKIMKWSDIRPEWPDEDIHLFGPGTDSGTFDFFTGAVVGEEGASRGDYQPSEDDNVIVQGVAGDRYALGYFGYAYYTENRDVLKAVAVNGTAPSEETIGDGSYAPLSRPIFIYVKKSGLERPEMQAYLKFHFTEGTALIPEVGYIPLSDEAYRDLLAQAGIR